MREEKERRVRLEPTESGLYTRLHLSSRKPNQQILFHSYILKFIKINLVSEDCNGYYFDDVSL